MKNLWLIVLILLIAPPIYGAAYTSTQSGDWSVVATWGGGGFPADGDTATISAGHTVFVDGDITVGTAPGNTTTYDLDINGTLDWAYDLGVNATLTVKSSIRVGATGAITIGDAINEFDCSYTAELLMDTTAGAQSYKIFLNSGTLSVFGCVDYPTSSGSYWRSRIASCKPDCNAGAGRQITLEDAVNWNSSAWDGDGILFGVGGNEATIPAAGDDPELVTSWTNLSSVKIDGVTFVEDHMVGDMVVNVSKNVLFRSNSATKHPVIYTAGGLNDRYDLNWLRIDEFGTSYTTTTAAICHNATATTLGSINYTAVTNCEDGGSSGGFYLSIKGWDSFTGNVVHDVRGGQGYTLTGTTVVTTPASAINNVFMEGRSGTSGRGMTNSNSWVIDHDGYWCSHATNCYTGTTPFGHIRNAVIHGTTNISINITQAKAYSRSIPMEFMSNEIRNSLNDCVQIANPLMLVDSNDIDGCDDNGIDYSLAGINGYIRSSNNTYDRCNTGSTTAAGGINITAYGGRYYLNDESFGQTAANDNANILIRPPTMSNSVGNKFEGTCNNCLFTTPVNVISTCGSIDEDTVFPYLCSNAATGYQKMCYMQSESVFATHNKDQVEYAITGIGPGGMAYERQTGVVSTGSNVKLKITPCDAVAYSYMPLGSFYINNATAFSVSVYLRKDTAIATAGNRPRLAVAGCGMDREVKYAEMTDVNDTWQQVTVTGTSNTKGAIHIYAGVKGILAGGGNDYVPVWPPTLDVYVDGLSVTK